jgi:hypothetical protein
VFTAARNATSASTDGKRRVRCVCILAMPPARRQRQEAGRHRHAGWSRLQQLQMYDAIVAGAACANAQFCTGMPVGAAPAHLVCPDGYGCTCVPRMC